MELIKLSKVNLTQCILHSVIFKVGGYFLSSSVAKQLKFDYVWIVVLVSNNHPIQSQTRVNRPDRHGHQEFNIIYKFSVPESKKRIHRVYGTAE